jgi:hypothetical protein
MFSDDFKEGVTGFEPVCIVVVFFADSGWPAVVRTGARLTSLTGCSLMPFRQRLRHCPFTDLAPGYTHPKRRTAATRAFDMVDDCSGRRGVARNHASEKTPQRIGILSSNRSGLSQITEVTSSGWNRPNRSGGINPDHFPKFGRCAS